MSDPLITRTITEEVDTVTITTERGSMTINNLGEKPAVFGLKSHSPLTVTLPAATQRPDAFVITNVGQQPIVIESPSHVGTLDTQTGTMHFTPRAPKAEPPDFEQRVKSICQHFGAANDQVMSDEDDEAFVLLQLLQVWNARGAADVAAIRTYNSDDEIKYIVTKLDR